MQQPKKRNPKDMAPRAYTLFKRAERTNRVLTVDVICNYTGYSVRTFKGHWSKKYRQFLHHDGNGGYTVNGLSQITRAEFLSWHSQLAKPSQVKEVDRYYKLVFGTVECRMVIVVLVLAGIVWR